MLEKMQEAHVICFLRIVSVTVDFSSGSLIVSCIYQYVRVIRCMMKYLHLIVRMDMLLKELRAVLASNCDLVAATIPHRFHGTYQPKEWVVVMHWDGIR